MVAIERYANQSLDYQAQRLTAQHDRREASVKAQAQAMTQTPADVARLVDLEAKIQATPAAMDELATRLPTEMDHNRALEASLNFVKQLDELLSAATKRFDKTLALLDQFQQGLGQRLRQKSDEIYEAEFGVGGDAPPTVASPSITEDGEPPTSAPAPTAVDK